MTDADQARATREEISAARPKKVRAVLEGALDRYLVSTQVHLIGDEMWGGYPPWRRENGAGRNRRNGVREIPLLLTPLILNTLVANSVFKDGKQRHRGLKAR
jgi:hypothetical protein